MDNVTKLNLLYDYYGDFLTEKQREIFELYYQNDLSLGEIAENSGVTRQGVHDTLRRSQEILNNFEEKLGMIKKHFKRKQEIEEILKALKELEPGVSTGYEGNFSQVYNSVSLLLKEGGE